MDTRRSQSPLSNDILVHNQDNLNQEYPSDKIRAYYSLIFPTFTFYIQKLTLTIGRRCTPIQAAATTSSSEPVQVDVDLGALKSVSRLHAKIEYDKDEDRFVLAVIGRNGAWVDGVWSGSGTRAPLGERYVTVHWSPTNILTTQTSQIPDPDCLADISLRPTPAPTTGGYTFS